MLKAYHISLKIAQNHIKSGTAFNKAEEDVFNEELNTSKQKSNALQLRNLLLFHLPLRSSNGQRSSNPQRSKKHTQSSQNLIMPILQESSYSLRSERNKRGFTVLGVLLDVHGDSGLLAIFLPGCDDKRKECPECKYVYDH